MFSRAIWEDLLGEVAPAGPRKGLEVGQVLGMSWLDAILRTPSQREIQRQLWCARQGGQLS